MEPSIEKKFQKRFTTTEICRIIKTCKTNNVADLTIGDLEISFNREIPETFTIGSQRKLDLPELYVPVTTPTQVVEKVEQEFGVQDLRALEELQHAQLLIDDPIAFEDAEIDAAIHGSSQQVVTINEDERHW